MENSTGNKEEVLVMNRYKCENHGIPVNTANGSTIPLVTEPMNVMDTNYEPFHHRRNAHATSNFETLLHLLKGSLGTGILAMPMAFMNSGGYFGLVATFTIGIICTYCVHVLVKCSHVLCRRTKVPTMSYADVAEAAFLTGRPCFKKFSTWSRGMIDTFLCVDLLGCCCVYIVFVASNMEKVSKAYGAEISLRLWMLILMPALLLLCMIRRLKYLTPFSGLANILTLMAMVFTFYYLFQDIPSIDTMNFITNDWKRLPLFFGTAIFALEGIGVVMPLENNMRTPKCFLGWCGVLNIGMFMTVMLYATFGFFGYLKYGEAVLPSITLNLPNTSEDYLAQSVKVMIAIAILITYALQFYVPFEIMWKAFKNHWPGESQDKYEIPLRMLMVTLTGVVAIAVPDMGPFISLIGAVCLSNLGLIFPSIIEMITYWDEQGADNRVLVIRNVLIIMFGILGFITGAYSSIQEIIDHLSGPHA